MQTIRAFISIEIPQEIKRKISLVQEQFKTIETQVSWVRLASIHLTIKFLGYISEEQISEIKNCMAAASFDIPRFTINIKGMGVFPNPNYPRVIWLGLEDKFDYLFRLQKGINDCLEKKGFEPEERGFTPHLTIGRIKSLKKKNQLIQGIYLYKNINVGNFWEEKINFMRSKRTRGGFFYNTFEGFKLRRS